MSITITICPLHDIDVTAIMAILGSMHTNYTPTIIAVEGGTSDFALAMLRLYNDEQHVIVPVHVDQHEDEEDRRIFRLFTVEEILACPPPPDPSEALTGRMGTSAIAYLRTLPQDTLVAVYAG